jgi:hypothetical protein
MPRSRKPLSQKQLTAAGFAVLRLEDLPAVAHLNAQELFALERITRAQNRILRARRRLPPHGPRNSNA